MDLVFGRPRYVAGAPLDLVFGDSGSAPALPLTVEGTIYFGGMSVSGTALYDNRMPNRVDTSIGARYQSAQQVDTARSAAWDQPAPIDAIGQSAWQSADRADAAPIAPWGSTERASVSPDSRWQHAAPISRSLSMVHQVCTPLDVLKAIGWQHAAPVTVGLLSPHQVATAVEVLLAVSAQTGARLSVNLLSPHQVATAVQWRLLARWQSANRLIPPGLTVYVPPGTGGPGQRTISLDLLFACPPYEQGEPLDLVFGHVCLPPVGPSAPAFILPARFYMQAHNLIARRLPDLTPVPIYGVDISADVGSYGWTMRVSGPRSMYDLLAPVGAERAQLRIELDGIAFSGLVQSRERDDAHGSRSSSATVHSLTALLASPYARETQRLSAAPFTAQQLALQALDLSGFGLSWGLDDWLVPAGAWSHSGTPLAAVMAIVEAAGGYLQSARNAPTLLARHPYRSLTLSGGGLTPGVPWSWGLVNVVPDVEISPMVMTQIGAADEDGPDINAVYLAGTTESGLQAFYKRTGTAGEKLAGHVSDPLLTAAEVLRQRGRAIVGKGGRKQRLIYTLPVLTGASRPGVLDVGQLVQINEAAPWRGMVRSVSVSAPHGREVRQTVEIERHLASA